MANVGVCFRSDDRGASACGKVATIRYHRPTRTAHRRSPRSIGQEPSIRTHRFRPPLVALVLATVLTRIPAIAAPNEPVDTNGPEHGSSAHEGDQHGNASYYAKRFAGRKTASGERYDPKALTAAHRSLPMGTRLRITNPKNDRSVVVTVNDRGRLPKNRVVDVSSAAADALDMKKSGVTRVETRVEPRAEPRVDGKNVSPDAPTTEAPR